MPMICPLIQDECLEEDCAWYVDGECAIAIIASSLSENEEIYDSGMIIHKMKEKW